MSKTNGNGAGPRVGTPPTRDRTLGSSPLTVRIYRTVLEAGRPLTAQEIYDRIKDVPGFHTDTQLWWRRKYSPSGDTGYTFQSPESGLWRVRERVTMLAQKGILVSDAVTGRSKQASYEAGRPPKGYAKIPPGPVNGHYGWYDIDVAGQQERLTDHLALVAFLQSARAELDNGKAPARIRRLLTEAVRLLEKVSFQ